MDPYAVPEDLLRLVPRDLARQYGIVPVAVQPNGRIEIASSNLLTREQLDDVERRLGHPVDLSLTTTADVAFAIHRRYPPEPGEETKPAARPVGQKLVDAGILTREQLDALLRDQRRRFRRLGDVLLDRGWLTRAQLDEMVLTAARSGRYIGDCLIERGWLTRAQLDEALAEQRATNRHLGELLLERQLVSREALEEALEDEREGPTG